MVREENPKESPESDDPLAAQGNHTSTETSSTNKDHLRKQSYAYQGQMR